MSFEVVAAQKRVEMRRGRVWLEGEKRTSSGQLTYHITCGGSVIRHCLCLLWNSVIEGMQSSKVSLPEWQLLGLARHRWWRTQETTPAKCCKCWEKYSCNKLEGSQRDSLWRDKKVWRGSPSCSKVWKQQLNRVGLLILSVMESHDTDIKSWV